MAAHLVAVASGGVLAGVVDDDHRCPRVLGHPAQGAHGLVHLAGVLVVHPGDAEQVVEDHQDRFGLADRGGDLLQAIGRLDVGLREGGEVDRGVGSVVRLTEGGEALHHDVDAVVLVEPDDRPLRDREAGEGIGVGQRGGEGLTGGDADGHVHQEHALEVAGGRVDHAEAGGREEVLDDVRLGGDVGHGVGHGLELRGVGAGRDRRRAGVHESR